MVNLTSHFFPKRTDKKSTGTQSVNYDTVLLSPIASHAYIPGLDGLRAIAVLIVLLAHFGLSHILPGGFGVTIFFIISGFLITRLLLSEQKTKGHIALKNFYIRRIIRLYPALAFMVLSTTLAYYVMGFGGPTGLELTAALGYFTNIFQVNVRAEGLLPFMPWTHLWSLAVEEHFYLLFPLILILCGIKWNRLKLSLMACLIIVPLWRFITFHYLTVPVADYNYMMTDARIDSIVWGCLLAVLLHAQGSLEPFKRFIGVIPFIIAVGALLFSFLFRDDSFRYIWRYSLQGAALSVLLLNLYYWKFLKFSITILEVKPLVWIGKTSYGLYLWHYPIYDIAQRTLGNTVYSLMITVAACLVMTAFSYYVVEKSFLKLRKRYGSIKPIKPPETEKPKRNQRNSNILSVRT